MPPEHPHAKPRDSVQSYCCVASFKYLGDAQLQVIRPDFLPTRCGSSIQVVLTKATDVLPEVLGHLQTRVTLRGWSEARVVVTLFFLWGGEGVEGVGGWAVLMGSWHVLASRVRTHNTSGFWATKGACKGTDCRSKPLQRWKVQVYVACKIDFSSKLNLSSVAHLGILDAAP